MVKGESRYFTLSPVGIDNLSGYSARYELIKQSSTSPSRHGDVLNNGTSFEVKIQTNDLEIGIYSLNVFITSSIDGFTQVYNERFELTYG